MRPVILYVDDDQANLTVFEALCGPEFEIATARDGAAALELLETADVAVLMTDQRMPGMSGAELAAIVRRRFPDTVRYLVTAYSDVDGAVDAINEGHVRRYIRKPWDAHELRALLREGVELYETVRKVRRLERRMREVERIYSLGVVAASVAHELRNPMAVLVGSLELAVMELRDLVRNKPALAQELESISNLVKNASTGAARATEVLEGIELSSRRQLVSKSCHLAEVIKVTIRMAVGQLKARGSIVTELEDVPMVRGSTTKLGQVVLNLIVNAIQAFPADRRSDNLITLRVKPDGNHVILEVEDNGQGIPEDIQQHVFDPFFTTKSDGGTGLGLAISKQIIEEIGGTMDLDSRLGGGTRFTVRIPVAT